MTNDVGASVVDESGEAIGVTVEVSNAEHVLVERIREKQPRREDPWDHHPKQKNAACLKRRNVACSEDGGIVSAQCPSVFIACPGEGGSVCTQCPSVVPV